MADVSKLIAFRKSQDLAFQVVGALCTALGIIVLFALLIKLGYDGFSQLNFHFLSVNASGRPEQAGILMAWVGTLLVMIVTFLTAVPLGVAAAVYLEEYAGKNWFTKALEINISNLAGVPSITYGLMALWFFRSVLHFQKSTVFVGGVTLAILVLPVIIVATREALRAIPSNIREAAYAAGATKWQVIRFHLLPYSLGGIATGTIIAMSRAIGETAPLLVIGSAGYVNQLPAAPIQPHFPFISFAWLNSSFSVLPMQMYNWTGHSNPKFQAHAAATGLVLIAFTLTMNAVAIWIRYQMRKKIKW